MKIKLYLPLFILSCSVLLYEVLVVRIYSVFYLSSQLFIIFSLASLGIGFGGILAYYYIPKLNRPGVTVFLAYPLLLCLCLAYITNYYYFLPSFINVGITSIPFVLAGYIISLLYRLSAKDANHAFLYDLIGGAMGCFLSIPIVYFGFNNALFILILIGAFVPVFFFWDEPRNFLVVLCGFGMIIFLILFFIYNNTLKVSADSLRQAETPIGWMLNYKRMAPRLIETRWDIYSRVDLVETGDDASSKTMYINGGTEAVMLRYIKDRQKELNEQKDSLLYFPYKFDKNDNVLVLGAGGGRDVHLVLLAGAKHVTAVEINKGVVELTNKYKEYTGNIFERPEVETVIEDARTFVMKDKRKYDRIILSLASTYAFSDLSSISQLENYLYTKEAFSYYFDRLKSDGTLTIFIDYEELMDKFVITALSYFEDIGISPLSGMSHIIAVGNTHKYFIGYSYAIIIKKSAYENSYYMDRINEYVNSSGFQSIIVPYNKYSEKYEPLAMGEIKLKKFIQQSENNMSPPNDDKPYFMEIVMNLRKKLIFLAVNIALIIFILWSLYYRRLLASELPEGDTVKRLQYLRFGILVPYFSLSGMASMLIEITLTKIFSYYLGYPELNIAVILFSLLLGFGIGSLWAVKFKSNIFHKISIYCIFLSGLLIIMTFMNGFFLRYTIGLPLFLRIILVVMYLFPAAFLMGIPFPSAIRTLGEHLEKEVPWLWGINGTSSVLGSVLAVIISMSFGIKFALFFGIILYIIIAFLSYTLSKQ
ncbi:hypothetical protein HY745_00040 [Candidatus Desantisbacteria bacterium]|nr:hypothetical protein [Candidatus Desantisbacteria bacterium]